MDIITIDENLFSLNFAQEQALLYKTISEKEHYSIIEALAGKALSILTLLRRFECLQIIFEKSGAAELFSQIYATKVGDIVNKVNLLPGQEIAPVFFFVLNRGSDLLDLVAQDTSYGS